MTLAPHPSLHVPVPIALARMEELGYEEIAEDVIIRPMLTMNRAADLWLGDLAREGKRPRTLHTYSRIVSEFVDGLPVDVEVAKVTADDIRKFLDRYLRKSRGTQAQVFSILNGLFTWLLRNEKIKRSPMALMLPPRRLPPEALDVTTVSSDDVRRMMAAAQGWTEKLSVGIVAYMGPRRSAVAQLRVRDYDPVNRTLKFLEKGGKTIWKPVPDELAEMIEARLQSSGAARPLHGSSPTDAAPDDYLIPSESAQRKPGDRDDRIIWKAVKRCADRAGVKAHVHALRAAFAVYYLEVNHGDLEALQPLMGHRDISTTSVYLRRLDRGKAMERVRGLSWV